ncbi:MBL fold metallo-hydrolase [Sphingopyxis sp.]|uniref:MBL fold metallo-hydrolase n=1 Tax=Sphingopyxis sp. TaxID=1908224 RepID=UPI003D10721C
MLRAVLLASALLLAPIAATAQDFSKVEIKTEVVTPGIAVLFGAGGNIAVSHGADGTVLVDDQFAPLTPKLEAAVAALGATPVKWLINTHWHGDHSGGNENFGKAGAMIMAHDHVRERMAAGQPLRGDTVPPAAKEALPILTYHDGISLHLNGDTLRVMHAPHAHTDGDSILHWETANVFHMGDTFFNKVTLPFIDLESGGSAYGLLAAADKVLALANDKSVIIPGHGPLASKADLAAYRAMLAEVIAAVESAKAAGKTLEQVQAMKPAAKYEVKGGFISGDAFVAAVFSSEKGHPKGMQPDRSKDVMGAKGAAEHDHGGGSHSH